MEYEWDESKRRTNLRVHGINFAVLWNFRWETALEIIDNRFEYGEDRFIAIGFLGNRLVVLTYTERGNTVRVISLRKATKTERNIYHEHN